MEKRMNVVNFAPWMNPGSPSQGTSSGTSGNHFRGLASVMTIPQAKPHMEQAKCQHLFDILEKRQAKYEIPLCLMNVDNAYIFEGIVAHTFFDIIEECHREAIIGEIRAFNVMYGKPTFIPSLSVTTLIPWTSRALNISRFQASIILGDFMQLRPERCFSRFPLTINCAFSQRQREEYLVPESLVTGGFMFRLTAKYPIRGMDGQILQLACRYSAGDAHVTVYADSSLRFGAQELHAFLPARDLIEARPQSRVQFCMCADILWRYIARAREGKLAEREGVVVTGNFGTVDELEALDLHPLIFHPVVIICPKERQEFNAVERFANRCMSSGATRVSVFSEPMRV